MAASGASKLVAGRSAHARRRTTWSVSNIFGALIVAAAVVIFLLREEQELVKTVDELRIEIDHAKYQQQLAEITESEFFANLQARARELRHRRST